MAGKRKAKGGPLVLAIGQKPPLLAKNARNGALEPSVTEWIDMGPMLKVAGGNEWAS